MSERVRFNREITEPACGDHPTLLMARRGEEGVILRDDGRFGFEFLVKPAGGPEFWCNENEFVRATTEPEEARDE